MHQRDNRSQFFRFVPGILAVAVLLSHICMPAYGLDLPPEMEAVPIWTDALGDYTVNIACSGDGRYIVAGSDTGILRLYDEAGHILWTYEDNRSNMDVVVSGDGSTIAAAFFNQYADAASTHGEILVFNRTGYNTGGYETGATVHRLAITDNGDRILASANDQLMVLDNNADLLQHYHLRGVARGVTLSGDGKTGVAAVDNGWRTRDGNLTLISREPVGTKEFRTENRAVAVTIARDAGSIIAVDENMAYSFSPDGSLRWEYPSGPRYQEVAVSDDGNLIAAASQYFLRVFDANGTILWMIEDHGYIRDVAVSGSGDRIIAGVPEGKTTLFDRGGNVIWWYNSTATEVAMSRNGDYYLIRTKEGVAFFNRWGNRTTIHPVETQDPMNTRIPISGIGQSRTIPAGSQVPETASVPVTVTVFLITIAWCCAAHLQRR